MGNIFAILFEPKQESEDIRVNKRISKLDSNLNPSEKQKEIEKIKKEEKKKTLEFKKKSADERKKNMKFEPTSLFIDRTPKELDERVKAIVKNKLKENPNMTDEELTKLISDVTVMVVENLATECAEEYALMKTILNPKYGNGKWPTKKELEKLIDEKNFPWSKGQIMFWPEEKDITSCQVISAIKQQITMNNICIYSPGYSTIVKKCDANCGKGTEIKAKSLVKNINEDFPSLQSCGDKPQKEFICDSGKVCKEDCKLEIDFKSFSEARCSKPCDSGDGPGEKTYKIKYLKSSKSGGSCDLDETGKKEGESYDITVSCNKDKCPDCSIKSKGPYKDDLIDYTKSVTTGGKTKTYTACLIPNKATGTTEDVDCGGAKGGFNYNKGARSKYSVSYNITNDDYGVQSCTKGEDVVEEPCSVNAFTPNLQPLVKDGEIVKGGGEPCGDECVLSDDYPQLVLVDGKECSKDCGTGKRRMRKVVKSKSDAPYCPCKNDPSKCPYEEIDCNTTPCIADCVYGNDGKHVQINDYCPGIEGGANENIKWDTEKDKWYDPSKKKHYPRNHFMKHLRVPTKEPPIGKGKCYQGNKADLHLQCSTELDGLKKPIHGKWGPWVFDTHLGGPNMLQSILPDYKKWDDPSNPNSQAKIDKRVQDRLDANEKDPITGEVLTEDRIRIEENHCIDEAYTSMDLPLPELKYVRQVEVYPQHYGNALEGESEKIIPYMKKDDGTYKRYCPINAVLVPDVWEGDGNQIGPEWDEDKCYVEGRQDKGGNVRSEKYTVKQLEDEAKKKFIRDSNLPDYKSPRTGENRIIGPGTRSIFRTKTREDVADNNAKYGGLPTGKWHSTTGDQKSFYDRRNTEYDECDGVRTILNKINKKIDNTPDWKANDTYVYQKNCSPVYDWDGKYYMSDPDAQLGKTGEEIKTNTDTGRVGLSDEKKKKYPASSMRKTTNGKFLTNYMFNHRDCKRPGLDSAYAWCGQKSTDDFIQTETVSGGLEMIKGVVTQGRKNKDQWVKTFEVYVSRNGDSWQQVKDASGNFTFTGNTDRSTKKTNYFQNRVEAKYIRFVTKTWGGHNSMRVGYIKDLSGTVDCNGGDGMLKGEPWYRITFNKKKTIDRNGMSQGTHSDTKQCPDDGAVITYRRGKTPVTGFDVNKLSISTGVADLQTSMNDLTSSFGSCGNDASRSGWYNSTAGTSTGWSDCYKTKSAAQTTSGSSKAVCVDDGGHNYKFNLWTSVSTSDYKPWKPKDNYDNYSTSDKAMHRYNVTRQQCFRKKCHKLPNYSTPIWTSTHSIGGNKSKIMNLTDKGTDGYVKNNAYNWENKFNNELITKVAAHWGITPGSASDWKTNNYKIKVIEGCCDGFSNKYSWSSTYRGRSKTKIGNHSGSYGWHSPNKNDQPGNRIFHTKNALNPGTEAKAREYCESKGQKFATLKDINANTAWSCARLSGEGDGFYRFGKWNKCTNSGYGPKSVFCKFWNVSETPDNKFVYARWNFSEEKKKGTFYPVGFILQPYKRSTYKSTWPSKIKIKTSPATIEKIETLPAPTSRDQKFYFIFSPSDRESMKDINYFYIYCAKSSHSDGRVAFRTNFLYGIDGDGQSIEKFGM